MGEYYRDVDHMFEIYGHFLERILTHERIGPKMSSANIIVKFIYTDPDCEITIDLRNTPERSGASLAVRVRLLQPMTRCLARRRQRQTGSATAIAGCFPALDRCSANVAPARR